MAEFPKEFVWGAATAAYQIEGGATEGGKGLSIWDVFSHTPGCTYRGETGDVACDSYHRWKEDLALLQSMHLKAYRFSVAWTRIAPNGGTDWNEEGFAYYDTLVDALLEAGIEPYVTLYHWDLPQALEEKGGWRSEETARAFASYAAKMAEHFKGRVHQWFTFNEPACIVKMGYGTGEHAPGPLSSATPRPIIQPSRISILKGSSVQPLPSGTTSTWQMVARYFSASAPANSA